MNKGGFPSLMTICAGRHDAARLAIKAHEVYAFSRAETRFFALGYPEQFDCACNLTFPYVAIFSSRAVLATVELRCF